MKVVNQLCFHQNLSRDEPCPGASMRKSSSLDLQRPICCTSAHQFSLFPHTGTINFAISDTHNCGSLTTINSNSIITITSLIKTINYFVFGYIYVSSLKSKQVVTQLSRKRIGKKKTAQEYVKCLIPSFLNEHAPNF